MTEQNSSTEEFVQRNNEVMRFEVHLQSIFKEISSGVSLEEFRQLFGEILKDKPPSMIVKLHSVFVQELYRELIEEMQLEAFVAEENLEEKFAKRAKLSQESPLAEGEEAWRPTTGDVTQQLRSHDMNALIKFKQELEEFVLAKEACVEHLKAKVSSLRLKAQKLDANIDASRRLLEERVLSVQRVRDDMLGIFVEHTQNTKKQ